MGTGRIPEAIIFDFDGTLVDSEKITFQLAMPIITKHIGRELTAEELSTIKGKVWKSAFKKWLPDDHEKLYQEIVDNWKAVDPVLPLYPFIREMLENLNKTGIPMAIVSSRERSLISRDLERLSIDRFFKIVVGQEDTGHHKPDPEPLLLASDLLRLENNFCIYIGDQVSDITASRAAGMISGGAFWGEGVKNILKDAAPDYLFSEPNEVVQQIFGMRSPEAE